MTLTRVFSTLALLVLTAWTVLPNTAEAARVQRVVKAPHTAQALPDNGAVTPAAKEESGSQEEFEGRVAACDRHYTADCYNLLAPAAGGDSAESQEASASPDPEVPALSDAAERPATRTLRRWWVTN